MRKEATFLAAAKREAAERNRKGKYVESPSKVKKPRPASLGVVIREATADPAQENPCLEDEQHLGAYGRQEFDLDEKALEDMVKFKDPKLKKSCTGRVSKSRPAQSGKKIHLRSLRMIGAKEQFLEYIRGIGFEWILEHTPVGVPVNLAKEFFISFRFKSTTDLDKESVYFRFFNQDMAMNLREWSLRMGMMSPEADERGDWSKREIGQPREIKEFNEKEAWELIEVKGAAQFKTSESTTSEIADPILRLAHIFLANNLMGHLNTTITSIELYFMWCMLKKFKLHLGYWLAHSCHKIAHHPVRHLYACHLVGAYFMRNVMPRMIIPVSSIEMCEDPEWFGLTYFANLGLIERDGDAVVLCDPDQSERESEDQPSVENDEIEKPTEVNTSQEKPRPAEVEQEAPEEEPCSSKRETEGTEEEWQRIIEFMMNKSNEEDERQRKFMELQNENLTKALSLVERMTDLSEAQTKVAQQLLASASNIYDGQPHSTSPEPSPKVTPVRVLRKRKEIATTSQPPTGTKKTRKPNSPRSQRGN